MKQLILLRGLPGAGKSTLAESLGLISYEADDWFIIFNDGKFDGALLGSAHAWCQDCTRMTLLGGRSVVVSNTSTTQSEVETYRRIADECDALFVSLIVENRHEGASVHDVPEKTIKKMRDRFSIRL